jgi:hypothetical protein
MEFFCGLDVGMHETSICVVDEKGNLALQVAAVTDPDAIETALQPHLGRLRRVGHSISNQSRQPAGPYQSWHLAQIRFDKLEHESRRGVGAKH